MQTQKQHFVEPAKSKGGDQFWGFDAKKAKVQEVVPKAKPVARPKQQPKQNKKKMASKTTTSDDFGTGEMSSEFKSWCEKEMKSLKADMALAYFCYSLENSAEIREYMRDYLGSTPQVSQFASDFIKRKGFEGGGRKSRRR